MTTGEPVGVTAVVDGMADFKSNAQTYNSTIAGMAGQTQQSAGIMSGLGDIARTAIGYAVGTLAVDAFNKVREAAGAFFADALAGEQQQAQLGIQVRNANQALDDQAAAYAAASSQTVSSTRLSADALDKLNDKYAIAKAKLDDMLAAYPKLKHPTETQTLNLQLQREKVDELSAAIAQGSEVITTNVGALNKIPLAAGFSVSALNALANQYRDLVGGSDEAVTSIEMVGLEAGSVSSDQMPQFIQRVADLGAVMGDTSTAALLLARANEDPVMAMNRANRAGILFSTTLKDQIKDLVKHNQTAEATKLVLDRIAQATAGAAAANANTLAGRWEILKNHLADAGKSIAMDLLPFAEKLFDQVIKPAIPLVENFARAFGSFLGGLTGAHPGTAFGELRIALIGLVPNEVIDALAQVYNWINSMLPQALAFVSEAVATATNVWTNILLPGLQGAWTWIQTQLWPLLQQLGDIVLKGLGVSAGELGQSFTTQMLPALQTAAAWAQANLLPLLSALWDWIKTNLPGAVQFLVDAWNTVLLPTLINFYAWYYSTLGPLLADLFAWLKTNLPIALQILADFWTKTLQPALLQVWAWMEDSLFPTLSTLWTWIQQTLTDALQKLADFWTNTLQPAILAVWAWMNDPLFPFLSALSTLIGLTIVASIQGWIDIWNKYLSPAIHTLYDFLNEHVVPLLKDAGDYLNKTLSPAFGTLNTAVQWLVDHALAAAKTILDNINQAIRDATAAVQSLINWIHSIPGIPSIPSPPSSPSSTSTSVSGPAVSSGVIGTGASISNSSVSNYNYAPTYAQGPVSPATDFLIMGALA